MTLAEQLRNEGMQKGVQQGKLEGEQMLLIEQLTYRFSSLKSDHKKLIKYASTEELLRWSKKIFSAKSIDEVFEN